MGIENTLRDAGIEFVEGYAGVKNAIGNLSDGSSDKLCSGYRVFPDGSPCAGCKDCLKEKL